MKGLTALFLITIGLLGLLIVCVSPAATAGIQITYDGKPIDNLEVRVYLSHSQSGSNTSPDKIATTDGTGLVTININYGDLWQGGSILYDFGYNGIIYSFSEPLTQIVEVSV
jgi:hypothetical protein